MGKQGPCYHCRTLSTPLWRNGPPGKPVLCNACGSRWRTRGSLVNYIPKHAQSYMFLETEESKNSHQNELPFKVRHRYIPIIGHNGGNPKVEESTVAKFDLHSAGLEDDTSYRSSSGSAISSSESCLQLENKDGNKISGSIKTSVWGSHIPSRKRSLTKHRSLSSVERLRRELYYLLHYQKSSNVCGCPEEELLYFENDQSTEIGLGSVLLKASTTSTEQKSEICPSPIDNKVPFLNNAHKGSNLTNTPLSDLDALQIENSPHMHASSKPSNEEGFKSTEENFSYSSHHLGGETSVTTKRTLDPQFIQTSEGSNPIRAFKKPKEEPETEDFSSILSSPSNISLHGISNMLSMKVNEFEPLDKYLKPASHSNISYTMDDGDHLPQMTPMLGNGLGEATQVDMTSKFLDSEFLVKDSSSGSSSKLTHSL